MENDLRTDHCSIINGFQFNKENAELMAFALDIKRLGGRITREYFDCRILEDDADKDFVDQLIISGPRIRRRQFDLFESRERCVDNALIILHALNDALDTIVDQLKMLISGRHTFDDLHANALAYLSLTAGANFNDVLNIRRLQSAVMYDFEPVLIRVRSTHETQYVLSGESHHWSFLETTERVHRIRQWKVNHGITQRRMQESLNLYLYTTFPERFNRGEHAE